MMRIGYLVPEFPSQTHAFFWREIAQLERLGVGVDLVSTRRPAALPPHAWASEAAGRTTYLFPIPLSQYTSAMWQLMRAGPVGWGRGAAAVVSSMRESVTRPLRMLVLAALGARLAAIAARRRWDHLHVHSCADAANIALFSHIFSRLPYSLTLHGDIGGYGANQRNKWRNASFAVVICAALIEQVRGVLKGDAPACMLQAPMGVDVLAFTRRTNYVPFNGEGAFRVFSCGRLHPGKGHHDLIDAVAELRRQGIDARLTIAGEAPQGSDYRGQLESAIDRLQLKESVRLAGALSEQAVRDELESAHVFALASHIEGLGVATMEAMAMRLPVVVTRSGGVAELVEHGREGLLVEPRQPQQLAGALTQLAGDPALCAAMGEGGREKIERAYHSGLSARAIVEGIEQTHPKRDSIASIAASMHPAAR